MAARFAVITGNWTGAIWAATAGGAAGSAAVPTSADDVTINTGVTVTLDTTGCQCLSVTPAGTGTLTNTTAANWDFTVGNASGDTANVSITTGTLNLDMSAAATYTGTVYLNKGANTTGLGIQSSGTCSVTLKGATRKRWTRLNGAIIAGAETATVDDATGWRAGDRIIFGTTQAYNATPRIDIVTLDNNYVAGSTTLTWDNAAGGSGPIAYDHADNGYVGNFSSNLTIRPYGTNKAYVALDNNGTRNVRDVCFDGLGGSVFAKYGLSFNSGATAGTISNNAFYSTSSSNTNLVFLRFLGAAVTRQDNIFYCTTGNAISGQGTNITVGDWERALVFRSAIVGLSPINPGEKFIDCVAMACAAFGTGNYGTKFIRCSAIGCSQAVYSFSGGGTYSEFEQCDFGTEFGAYNSTVFNLDGAARYKTTDCTVQTSGTIFNGIPSSTKQAFVGVDLINKNADVAVQESYYPHCEIKRNNSTYYRSTSSISIGPTVTGFDSQRTVSIPCANGSSIRVVGYVKKSHATNVSATVALTGLGSSVTPFTKANDTAWEMFDLSATNSSGNDGNFTLTYTANSSSGTSNVVYFDGVPDSPFITKCRHYGYTYDESNPFRTVNGAISASEATAGAYTGISVTAATSAIAISTSNTFQQLYDYTQAWACTTANLGYSVPLLGGGMAGNPSLFAAGNVTISDGAVLNGSGLISMGAYTLSTEFASGINYTYTGGTWSQSVATPTFNGGTLTLPSLATSTSVASMVAPAEIKFGAVSALWDLGSWAFTSDSTNKITLTNTSGSPITVALPAGVNYQIGAGDTITVITPVVHNYAQATVLPNTRVVMINVTQGNAEIDNSFVTSPATAYSYEITTEANAGDTLDLYYFKEGYQEGRTRFTWGGATQTIAVEQTIDSAIDYYRTAESVTDYTTLTEFDFYAPSIYIRSNDPDGATSLKRMFIFYNGALTTEDGARYMRGGVTFRSAFDVVINRSVVPMAVDNVSATLGLYFTDESVIRVTTDDGTSWIAPPSAPGSIRYAFGVSPGQIETGVSGLTGPESAQLMALPSASAIANEVVNGITFP